MSNATEDASSSVANIQLFVWDSRLHDARAGERNSKAVILAFRIHSHDHDEPVDEGSSPSPSPSLPSPSPSPSHLDSFETYLTDYATFSDSERVLDVLKLALGLKSPFCGKTLDVLSCQIVQYLRCNFSSSCLSNENSSCLVVLVDIVQRFKQGKEQCSSSCFSADKGNIIKRLRESLRARDIYAGGLMSHELNRADPNAISEIIVGYRNEDEEDSCSICLEGYPKEDQVAFRTVCNHIFHGDCIMRSCLRKGTCPLCRAKLPTVCVFHGYKSIHHHYGMRSVP